MTNNIFAISYELVTGIHVNPHYPMKHLKSPTKVSSKYSILGTMQERCESNYNIPSPGTKNTNTTYTTKDSHGDKHNALSDWADEDVVPVEDGMTAALV